MKRQIGIDTGGTFTDFVIFEGNSINIHKRLSTPHNPSQAVIEGLKEAGYYPPANVEKLVIGATVATNAFLERKGGKVLLLITEGFEGVPFIGRQNRLELYNLHYRRPPHILEPENVIGVRERTGSKGEIITPLSEEEISRVVSIVKEKQPDAVAISFLFSFLNPLHEQKLAEVLRNEGFFVTASHEIFPEYREYERTAITIINSYLFPVVKEYVGKIEKKLGKDFLIMGSSGGNIPPDYAINYPVNMILSGPAGGVVAVRVLGELTGVKKLLSFDMGGTSTDVSIVSGEILRQKETMIDGFPFPLPLIYLDTIGTGGGSIARIDEGGALKVGPESAGADPGPICYGRGGKNLTITDANLFLGRINPNFFLGGKMKLDTEGTKRAFEQFSAEWGITPLKLAEGIIEVANTGIARALRKIATSKGFDPSEFHIVSFGGAGGLHVCDLAEKLDIDHFISPRYSGVFSALGVVWSDIVFEEVKSLLIRERDFQSKLLEEVALELEKKIMDRANSTPLFQRKLYVRYVGQSYELAIDYSNSIAEIKDKFEKQHKQIFTYTFPGNEIEIVSIEVKGIIPSGEKFLPHIECKKDLSSEEFHLGESEGYYRGEKIKFNLYNREKMPCGVTIKGPALLFENTSTLFIAPGWYGEVDQYENVIGGKE